METINIMIQDTPIKITNYKVIEKKLVSEGIGKTRELARGMEYVEITHWEEVYLLKLDIEGTIVEIKEIVKTKQKPGEKPFYRGYIVEDYKSEKTLAKLYNVDYIDLY